MTPEEACRRAFEERYRRLYGAYPVEERDRLVARSPWGGYARFETERDYGFFKAGFDTARR